MLKLFKQGEKDGRCVKNVKNAEISSKNTFVNINVILGIVRKRRLTAEGPERASTTCSRRPRRGDDLKRYKIQRHRHRKETGPEVRRRYDLVKETIQQSRNGVKKVQYSDTDIAKATNVCPRKLGPLREKVNQPFLNAMKRTGVLHTMYVLQ